MAAISSIKQYNNSWTTLQATLAAASSSGIGGSRSFFQYNYYTITGKNSGGSTVTTVQRFNSVSTSISTPVTNGRIDAVGAAFNSSYYIVGGKTDESAISNDQLPEKFNGSAWTTWGLPGFAVSYGCAGAVPSAMYLVAGSTGPAFGANSCDFALSVNNAESASNISPSGNIAPGCVGGVINGSFFKVSGLSGTSGTVVTTAVRAYNGSSWSAGAATTSGSYQGSSTYKNNLMVFAGGTRDGEGAVNDARFFNSVSWTAGPNLAVDNRTAYGA